MASTCIHGFAGGECLICRTLQSAPTTRTAEARERPDRPPTMADDTGGHGLRHRRLVAVAPDTAVEAFGATQPRRSFGSRLVLLALSLAVLALAVWVVVGLAATVLHWIELIAVAFLAGWIGYRLGRRRSRR